MVSRNVHRKKLRAACIIGSMGLQLASRKIPLDIMRTWVYKAYGFLQYILVHNILKDGLLQILFCTVYSITLPYLCLYNTKNGI